MRAAVGRDGQAFAIERVPLPDPGPGEVRVRVTACGLCGSDLHLQRMGFFASGRTPGHEIAGVVDRAGSAVAGLAAGQTVAVEPLLSCGDCPECRSGRDPLCRKSRLLGVHASGGFAEYVVAPAGRLFPAPAELAPAIAALAEPLAVSIHGLRRGALESGQRVLVLGAGSVGLLTLLAAKALGAGEVWISARYPHQAERARALGADRVLGENEADARSLAALGAEAPLDLVVETVGGSADTLADGAAAVRPGGRVVVLGLFPAPLRLNTMPLMLKEVSLVWSYCYHQAQGEHRADFADAVALLSREPGQAALLTSHQVALDEIERAFTIASHKESGVIKVSVTP